MEEGPADGCFKAEELFKADGWFMAVGWFKAGCWFKAGGWFKTEEWFRAAGGTDGSGRFANLNGKEYGKKKGAELTAQTTVVGNKRGKPK